MANISNEQKLEPVPGGYRVRLRYGANQRGRFTIKLTDEQQAQVRAQALQTLANDLARAGKHNDAPIILRKGGQVATDREFREVVRFAEGVCSGKINPTPSSPGDITVKELGIEWTSGKLHKRYPDQIPLKRSVDDNVTRLVKYVYPVLQDKPIGAVTLDDCERVMRKLPADLSAMTRRNIGQVLVRLLNMAVYPLRLIERSPVPQGFLPKTPKPKAMGCLYPSEDARLMACKAVPLAYRLLWGFFTREGMRESEALSLTWKDLDLQRGAVRLDRNKTDDPRAWALSPGVAEALKLYREKFRAADTDDEGEKTDEAKGNELVFVDPDGNAFDALELAETLRGHLVAIGLKAERPELFTSTAERMMIRVHDLRGTFVTIALANGRSESWISDRTGHRSSQMIAKYKRPSRTIDEINEGDLLPLNEAIPELASMGQAGPPQRKSAKGGGPSRPPKGQIPRINAPGDTSHRFRKPQVRGSNPRVGSRKRRKF